ncbi:hypothetical protein CRE_04904 [Caenorhabditis remanei]|uniref:F-box domain-containing protein n=1 Tax=Caenorhabditis remanei TaxID=31234 RepID=E3MN87_CAERE|nr:hypothetical protein CRE_04904 [Caenorhabditis remanei]
MKFLRFPTLVLEKIFENFAVPELLFLSFCSKRMRFLIQLLEKCRLKDIKTINYSFVSDDRVMILGLSNNNKPSIDLVLTPVERKKMVPMGLFGMDRDMICCIDWSSLCWYSKYLYDKKKKEVIVQGVHNYLYQFFGPSIRYQVVSDCDELPPKLENIQLSHIALTKLKTKQKKVEDYFKASPYQEYMRIHENMNGMISQKSVVYLTKHLEIDCCHSFGDDALFRFKGSSLLLVDAMFSDKTLIRFLNEWKSGTAFQQLKHLSIHCPSHQFLDPSTVQREVGMQYFEGFLEMKWKQWTMVGRFQDKRWIPRSFKSRDYLIREFDGAGASIQISSTHFNFVVWSASKNSQHI